MKSAQIRDKQGVSSLWKLGLNSFTIRHSQTTYSLKRPCFLCMFELWTSISFHSNIGNYSTYVNDYLSITVSWSCPGSCSQPTPSNNSRGKRWKKRNIWYKSHNAAPTDYSRRVSLAILHDKVSWNSLSLRVMAAPDRCKSWRHPSNFHEVWHEIVIVFSVNWVGHQRRCPVELMSWFILVRCFSQMEKYHLHVLI
jgi:hypothetical protein